MDYKGFQISSSEETIEGRLNKIVLDLDQRVKYFGAIDSKKRVEKKLERIIKSAVVVQKEERLRLRIEASRRVLSQVLKILKEGFHPLVVDGMLKATLCQVAFGDFFAWEFEFKFDQLRTDTKLRKEVWGSIDLSAILMAKSIFEQLTTKQIPLKK